MYGVLIDKYAESFDSCFPFEVIKCTAFNSFRKPWLTKGSLRADVYNYRLGVGNIKILKNPKKSYVEHLGSVLMKIQIFDVIR